MVWVLLKKCAISTLKDRSPIGGEACKFESLCIPTGGLTKKRNGEFYFFIGNGAELTAGTTSAINSSVQ
jgi:hypothetical protein